MTWKGNGCLSALEKDMKDLEGAAPWLGNVRVKFK